MESETEVGLRALAEAGWFPGRQVAIDGYLAAVTGDGYRSTELLEEFLREYGGLSIGRPSGGFAEVIAIDPTMAVETTYKETVAEYEEILDVGLVPIGAASSGHLVLMLADNGCFYGGYDAHLAYAGNSPAELFGRISLRRATREA